SELLEPDPVHECREGLSGLPLLLVEAGEPGDCRGRVVLGEAAEPLAHTTLAFTHRSAHEDRVVRPLGAVAFGDRVTGEADVPDVVLPTGVGAAADLDREVPESCREAIAGGRIVQQVRPDPS